MGFSEDFTITSQHTKCGVNDGTGKVCGDHAFLFSFTGPTGPWVACCLKHAVTWAFKKVGCAPLVKNP